MANRVTLQSAALPRANWYVNIVHGDGSVEHFYHFLLGFFVPLVYYLLTRWTNAQYDRFTIRSCGPLDLLIRELGDERITIVDKDAHSQLLGTASCDGYSSTGKIAPENVVTVYGNDYPTTYRKSRFVKVRQALCSICAVRSEISLLAEQWPRGDARILLIQRGASHAFYESERSEVKGSGEKRRSIANHQELYRSIRRDHVGCIDIVMEEITFARQFALFSSADIIIAQHGAALANIIWARPRATVIEVFPKNLRRDQKEHNFFFNLSRCMGLRYRRVAQEHEHSTVAIDEICDLVKMIIAVPTSGTTSRLRSITFMIIHRPTITMRYGIISIIVRGGSVLRRLFNTSRVQSSNDGERKLESQAQYLAAVDGHDSPGALKR